MKFIPTIQPAARLTTVSAPIDDQSWRRGAAGAWLRLLFWSSRAAPWLVRLAKHPVMWITPRFSASVRHGTTANARRIFGSSISARQSMRFSQRVVGRFCDFVLSVGQSVGMTPQELRARIVSVDGDEIFKERRRRGDGAILITAHMGSFELGLAALAEVEPHIHVVFQRDAFDGFESVRTHLRQKLGVQEAPIDDGWKTWIKLRDALVSNHVIVLQADRVMPGQKFETVPFLGAHLRLPVGPLKLALASGSPIIPVFTIMTSPTTCRLFIEPAIEVNADEADLESTSPVMTKIGAAIEKFVAQYPDQWLVLQPAFAEDQAV
jgi:KDO2-lipid IV(A) lauroyltransferase